MANKAFLVARRHRGRIGDCAGAVLSARALAVPLFAALVAAKECSKSRIFLSDVFWGSDRWAAFLPRFASMAADCRARFDHLEERLLRFWGTMVSGRSSPPGGNAGATKRRQHRRLGRLKCEVPKLSHIRYTGCGQTFSLKGISRCPLSGSQSSRWRQLRPTIRNRPTQLHRHPTRRSCKPGNPGQLRKAVHNALRREATAKGAQQQTAIRELLEMFKQLSDSQETPRNQRLELQMPSAGGWRAGATNCPADAADQPDAKQDRKTGRRWSANGRPSPRIDRAHPKTIQPASWDANGGPGTIRVFSAFTGSGDSPNRRGSRPA